jgi:hypothetical protein
VRAYDCGWAVASIFGVAAAAVRLSIFYIPGWLSPDRLDIL